jgi:hypothetical protein
MKKLLFTLFTGLITFGAGQAADLPFKKSQHKSKVHERMQAHGKGLLPFTQLASNQRISNVTPDSVTLYEHDGIDWSIMFTGKLTYNPNGQPVRMLLYLAPPLSIPIIDFEITYNGSGKLTSLQQSLLFPVPSVEFRVEQRFDANQNVTSIKYFENDNGSLQLSNGDSIVYTYSGSAVTAAEVSYFDNFVGSAWVKSDRLSGISLNANNEVSAVTFQYWDEMLAAWSTEMFKYANIQWAMGYMGLEALIGLEAITLDLFFSAMPTPQNASMLNAPTNYIEWVVDGSMVDTLSRSSAVMSSGRVSQVLGEEYFMGTWMPSYRVNYTYNSSNVVVMATEQSFDGQNWEDSYRYDWEYNAQNHLTKEEEWYDNGTSLQLGYGQKYQYLYTTNNIPFQIITEGWTGMSYEFSNKSVYNFGSFNTATTELAHTGLKVYPNPVNDALNVQINANHSGELLVEVMGISGQRVLTQSFELHSGLNQVQVPAQQWQAGVYLVKIQSAAGLDVIRIVK